MRERDVFLFFVRRVPASLSGMSGGEVGQITFEFETLCGADCEFYFMMVSARVGGVAPLRSGMALGARCPLTPAPFPPPTPPPQDVHSKSTTVVESWSGSKGRQSYSHSMSRNDSVTFTWAFQRTSHALDVSLNDGKTLDSFIWIEMAIYGQ